MIPLGWLASSHRLSGGVRFGACHLATDAGLDRIRGYTSSPSCVTPAVDRFDKE